MFALVWLLLRTGTKPSRLAYPCQQAAISAATLAFGAPLVSAVISARRKLAAGLRTPAGMAVAALGLMVTGGAWGYAFWANQYSGPVLDPPRDYRAQVFQVTDCPQDPVGDHFVGLDRLLSLMGREGLKFYQSASVSLVAGPDGIIAADDVVIIKINYLPDERGCTNSDLLRGLIRRIVDHPDTFTGEIVVCENTQSVDTGGLDRHNNNAQNITLSPHDVVVGFHSQGYTISDYIWTDIRYTSVGEYSDSGDLTDGYVVGPYDEEVQGRVSYPKFQTDYGTYISLKYGVWDPVSGNYDDAHFKWISVPILKSHHDTYGVTACVKMHMGTGTGVLGANLHNAIYYGILGKLLAEVRMPDLNILDGIWIQADPYDGPYCSYIDATRKDMLFASLDPVALDIWSVKNVLIPAFIENGFSPPWPYPSADPDDPDSMFRIYLDRSMYYLLDAGQEVTNDLSQIDAHTWIGAGDFDADGDVDMDDSDQFELCFTGPGGGPAAPGCEAGDFDFDNDIDCVDWYEFVVAWTEQEPCPGFDFCPIAAPLTAPPPHDARKNRYISFAPNNTESVAFQIELTASEYFPGSTMVVGWVGEPDENDVGRVVSEPFFSVTWPEIVQVGDCEIVPVATYRIRATGDEVLFTNPLEVGTILRPGVRHCGETVDVGTGAMPPLPGFTPPNGVVSVTDVESLILTNQGQSTRSAKHYSDDLTLSTIAQGTPQSWADCVGAMEGGAWTAPNGVVNMDDIMAAVQKFRSVETAPHLTWVDIDPEVPNAVLNMADIFQIVQGFKGAAYPFSAPADCP